MSTTDQPHHLNGHSNPEQEAYTENNAKKFQKALETQKGTQAQGYRNIRSNAGDLLPKLAGAEAEVLIAYNNAARYANEGKVPSDKVSKPEMAEAEKHFREVLRATRERVSERVAGSYFFVVQEAALKALGITLVNTQAKPRR